MRILVAEDDRVSSARLAGVLTGLGHEAEVYQNGREAWEAFDKNPARVVISDWEMPEMDGLELCQKIRSREETDYTYFILVSAANTDETAYDKAIEQDVDDFLVKPLRRDAVSRRLRVAQRILKFALELQELRSLVPICMYCKKIRDDSDYWQEVECFLYSHTNAEFSHGVCPACAAKMRASFTAQKAPA